MANDASTPRQHDEKTAALHIELAGAEARLTRSITMAHHAAKDRKRTDGRRLVWGMTDAEALADVEAAADAHPADEAIHGSTHPVNVLRAYVSAGLAVHNLSEEIRALSEIYAEAPWNRYFLVTNSNGHVHRGMGCSTCFPTTEYAWLVELADCDEAAMIEEFGEKACTVCFPDAPANPKFHAPGRRDREAQTARDAEKAEKLAAKYAKKLHDDQVFVVQEDARCSERITTVAACLEVLRREVEFRDYYGKGEHCYHAGYVIGAEQAKRVLLAREAARPGTGATQEKIDRTIASAITKNRKDGARI